MGIFFALMKQNLQKLIEILGGNQQSLADVLYTNEDPVKQPHVWKWLNTTRHGIPERHVIKACASVNFKITPHELRPDIYPHPHDGLPEHMREVA